MDTLKAGLAPFVVAGVHQAPHRGQSEPECYSKSWVSLAQDPKKPFHHYGCRGAPESHVGVLERRLPRRRWGKPSAA